MKGCKPQVGHNDIAILRNTSPGYFFLLNRSEFGNFFACKEAHEFIFYPNFEKWKLASILKMEAISLPPFLISSGTDTYSMPAQNILDMVTYAIASV